MKKESYKPSAKEQLELTRLQSLSDLQLLNSVLDLQKELVHRLRALYLRGMSDEQITLRGMSDEQIEAELARRDALAASQGQGTPPKKQKKPARRGAP